MKAILCAKCVDLRMLRATGPVSCECGNVTGWWVDPDAGVVKVFAYDRDKAKIVGIHNELLLTSFTGYDFSSAFWRDLHDKICGEAEGYVFHKSMRNCPVAIMGVGMSADVSWADSLPSSTAVLDPEVPSPPETPSG